jgi:opine dehydrogenase
MKVAVLGSGNGGCAVAFDCAQHGHAVSLFDFAEFPDSVRAIRERGGIDSEGELSGFAPMAQAGHDIGETLDGAEVIFVVGPAYSTRAFAKACKPFLRKGQIVIVCPGSCAGSIEFKSEAGLPLRDTSISVAEMHTLPYAVRLVEPGRIKIFLKLKAGVFLAAVPASMTNGVLDKLRDIFPALSAAKNILQTSLQNGNPIIHPAVSLLNTALIERTRGDFFFYEEGVTPAVGRLIRRIDEERIALGKALGVDVIASPQIGCMQGYMTEATYDTGYSTAPGFKGIKAQVALDYRYFQEDVGYGLVFLLRLAEQVGVKTPCIASVITLVSAIMQRDYLAEAPRTPESLGLSGYTAEQLTELLA